MARGRHQVIRSRSTRVSAWGGAFLANTVIAASGKTLLASLDAQALALRPFTVIRTRLLISYESDQTTVLERPQGAFGMAVVSDQASAAGAASIPGPQTDTDYDWIVYQGLQCSFIFVSGAGFRSPGAEQYTVDSKSMRKVGLNEDLVFMVEQDLFGARIGIEGRFLIKTN